MFIKLFCKEIQCKEIMQLCPPFFFFFLTQSSLSHIIYRLPLLLSSAILISCCNTGKDFSSFYLAVDILSLFYVIGASF